jgi:hypothetical protein
MPTLGPVRHSGAHALPNRSNPDPVDDSQGSLASQMLPLYRPERFDGAHFHKSRGH